MLEVQVMNDHQITIHGGNDNFAGILVESHPHQAVVVEELVVDRLCLRMVINTPCVNFAVESRRDEAMVSRTAEHFFPVQIS